MSVSNEGGQRQTLSCRVILTKSCLYDTQSEHMQSLAQSHLELSTRFKLFV